VTAFSSLQKPLSKQKERTMRKHAAPLFAALVLLLLGGPCLRAQTLDNDGCSDATLKGDYAFTVYGQILNVDGTVTTRTGIAMTHFDGWGGLKQIDYVSMLTPGHNPPGGIDISPAFRQDENGTYHVNADCTGTAEIDFPKPPGGTSGAVIKLIFVLADYGREIHTVVTSLTPPNVESPVPVSIHSDGKKLHPII
jgi:hypothetical protein